MSRASQVYWYLQADEAPTVNECLHHYTAIDAVSAERRSQLNRIRAERKRRMDAYREYEQGDLLQLSNA